MISTAIQSTVLASITYDEPNQLLLVEFRGGAICGAIYCYFGVPLTVRDGLLAAPSKGAYFNRFVRAHFSFTRLTTANHDASPTTTN
jgi:lysyl-tRNA synthetase, class II